MRHYLVPSLLFALVAPLASCTTDDAGHGQFVQQVIPTLLGRKAKGSAEIDVLVEIITEIDADGGDGRGAVVDLLMDRPEFVRYWTLVLADALHARREGELSQPEACWEEPLAVTSPSGAIALADHIGDIQPDGSFTAPWNMHDALAAAVVGDDLAVAWLAYLPALLEPQQGAGDMVETSAQFTEAYLGRSVDCLACHTSAYSVVDAESGWDRHATSPWALETSVFHPPGYVSLPEESAIDDDYVAGRAAYRAYCDTCHDDPNLPFLDNGGLAQRGKRLRDRVPVLSDIAIEKQVTEGSAFMSAQPVSDVDALLVFLRVTFGATSDIPDYFRYSTHNGPASGNESRPRNMAAVCTHAVDPQDAFDAQTERPRSFGGERSLTPDVVELGDQLRSGLGGLRASLDAAPPVVDAAALPSLGGDTAFAYLVAQTIVDELADEVTGERLSVSHGFARNPDQAQARQDAIDALVVAEPGERTRLSLKNLLRELVLSEAFNRNAPAETAALTPFVLPMVLNPWVATDPDDGTPTLQSDANSQGDAVHRYSPNNATLSLHHSLGWPAPAPYPAPASQASVFMEDIGGFRSDDVPGFDEWDLQSLLRWEEGVGRCDLGSTDWIDALLARANDPAQPVPRIVDLFAATRDRLVGSAYFEQTEPGDGETGELALIEQMFGVPGYTAGYYPRNNAIAKGWIEQELRTYCGALLVSPQYTMAGLPLEPAEISPALVVCLPGETCTAADLEAEYRAQLAADTDTGP